MKSSISIRARILAAVALPALALLGAFSFLVFTRVQADRLADLDASLRARAAALAALVERDDDGRWEAEPLAPIAGAVAFDVRAWPDGPLIGASEEKPASYPDVEGLQVRWPRADDEPLPLLLDGRVATDGGARARTFVGVFLVRSEEPVARADDDDDGADDPGDDPGDDHARPLSGTSAAPLVRVVVSTSTAALDADMRSLARTLAAVGSVLGLLALLAGGLLSRRIVAPLAAMAAAAESMREPSAQAPIAGVRGDDEVARLGRSLNDAFARMYDAYERQRRFASDASHELRTPIAVVRTEAEVTLRAPRTTDEYQASLRTILDGTARMQRTVEGLLLLARADRGALQASMTEVDVAELAHDVVRRLPAPRVPVVVDVSPPSSPPSSPPLVRGNADHLRVMISNLVENAVRHARTKVTVSVRSLAPPVEAHGLLELRVVDDGDGIPVDMRERVFERFFRVDTARSRAHAHAHGGEADSSGAGLGLSIVRTIAELHGGTARAGDVPPGRPTGAADSVGGVLVVTLPLISMRRAN